MPLQAVTFDFWSTLVDGAISPQRTLERMTRLQNALASAGHTHTAPELRDAFDRALGRIGEAARESLLEVGPPGRWAEVAVQLGVPAALIPFEVVERAYEDLTLDPLPNMMPHVREAVEAMRARYRLAVICNTGMAGGRVLREVLRRHELLDLFDVTVFSDEFGFAKPHPSIFVHTLRKLGGIEPGHALHVGDMEELDVEGARRAGVRSARYQPIAGLDVHTAADFVVRDWRQFESQVADFERTLAE